MNPNASSVAWHPAVGFLCDKFCVQHFFAVEETDVKYETVLGGTLVGDSGARLLWDTLGTDLYETRVRMKDRLVGRTFVQGTGKGTSARCSCGTLWEKIL